MNRKNKNKKLAKKNDKKLSEKLQILNFNLKHEILCFLPMLQVMREMFILSKKILSSVKKIKYIKFIEENFNDLLTKANFHSTKMLPIIQKFLEIDVSEISANEIAQYLLIRKIRD